MPFGVLVVAAVLAVPSAHAASASCAGADVPATAQNATATRAAIVCLVDAARAERKRPALKANARLQTAAQRFARSLDSAKPLTHSGPGGSTPLSRIADAGYARGASGFSAAETLGRSKGSLATPSARVKKWLATSATRQLLLSTKYRDVGVGIAMAGNVATFVVEVASPATRPSSRSSR